MSKSKSHETRQYTMLTYEGGRTLLEIVEREKDIGVTVARNLNFEKHIEIQINKANQIVGLTRRAFTYLDIRTFSLFFKALVRPHLEYASSVWSLYKKKDIESTENVQKCTTKMLPPLRELSCQERLKRLKLPTLKFHRMREVLEL